MVGKFGISSYAGSEIPADLCSGGGCTSVVVREDSAESAITGGAEWSPPKVTLTYAVPSCGLIVD